MQAALVAIVSLAGVITGATLQYIFNRNIESRKAMALQKTSAYVDFFRAAAGLGQTRTSDLLALAVDAKARICLFGSQLVIEKLTAFEKLGATTESNEGRVAMAEILNAMRMDLLGSETQSDMIDNIVFQAWKLVKT